MKKKQIKILLAEPRGFWAGVVRAIEIVEKALKKYGSPVYVRHEIVHNKHVVEDLKKKGAVFVEELSDITDNTRPVIFSAHGVPKKVPKEAESKKMFHLVVLDKKDKNGNKGNPKTLKKSPLIDFIIWGPNFSAW